MPNHSFFSDYHCIVLATSQSQRQMISHALRELKLTHLVHVSDFKGCLRLLETERTDWILAPLFDAQNQSILLLLDLIAKEPLLQHIKC